VSGDCSFRFVDVSGIVAQCCSNLLLQDISCLFKRQNYLMQQSNKIRHRKKAICYRNNNKLKKKKNNKNASERGVKIYRKRWFR
jgi:hypothetical protein